MALARLQFGDEKLILGKEERTNNYYLSVVRGTDSEKEFAYYISNPNLEVIRLEFEKKAIEIMSLKPTNDLIKKH